MSRVSLQNPIASLEQLAETPSRKDGISEQLEDDLRSFGCELIQSAGILLNLPQVAMATAQVLFQRFFYLASLKDFGIIEIGMGALFLSAKVEESFVRMTYLITVYDHLLRRIQQQSTHTPLDAFSQRAYSLKSMVTTSEMQILKRLGFNVHVQLPYGTMINYLRILGLEEHDTVPKKAWNYLNDALRTHVYTNYTMPTIACGAIWLACRDQQVKLPTTPGGEWWLLFDAQPSEFQNVAAHIQRLYHRKLDRQQLLSHLSDTEATLRNS
ncbi:cyclin-like protein [Radiomyces spectabilis]|uniref:cyclin-like protein n=1 Tax=Radiomyces spectabilis TaxID=64574 RepID=UPI00221E7C23|nr:cyclin-like protein [Radiomyces spectabilis]KAI8384778.1 cyclin-like protein [Radiomyces spectabilis]